MEEARQAAHRAIEEATAQAELLTAADARADSLFDELKQLREDFPPGHLRVPNFVWEADETMLALRRGVLGASVLPPPSEGQQQQQQQQQQRPQRPQPPPPQQEIGRAHV